MSTSKRPIGGAGSPPATGPKPKKARQAVAMSRTNSTQVNTPAASSPPYFSVDSPAGGRARSRSRSRSRSASAAPAGKGKAREDTVGPGANDAADDAEPEGDDDEDELAYSDDEFGTNQRDYARQKEDLRVLLEHFDAKQMDRYEAYRRSGLNKASVRKLVNQVLQQSVGPSILTVVRGFAKVFVGEITEIARENATHSGALTPADLREAYRIYQDSHSESGRKKMFVR